MPGKANNLTISGAGPAGLTAAIILAKKGYKVRILEQRSRVGARFNDDFQGLENWSRSQDVHEELIAAGVNPTWWHRPFKGGVMFDPLFRPITVKTKRPLFYLVRRGYQHRESLDSALLGQAYDAGVEVVFNQAADPKAVDIVASGPKGIPTTIARGITFKVDLEDYACAFLDDRLAPFGYVYLLISDGQATLATVLFRNFSSINSCLEESIKTIKQVIGIKEIQDVKYWGGYGAFSIPKTCEREGSLWIGEAAGFQDALFGFGIRNALISAKLAAQSIIENRSYDDLWQSRLLPHLKASLVNRMLYEKLGNLAKKGLWYFAGNSKNPDRFMRWLYNSSFPHNLIFATIAKRQSLS